MRTIRRVLNLAGFVLVVACLYWAQAVFIPLAVALLLTVLLTPVVVFLQRWRFGRVGSAFLAVILAAAVLGGIGWVVTRQVDVLIDELPRYRQNIRQRIAMLRRAHQETLIGRAQETVREVTKQIEQQHGASGSAEKPVRVVVEPPQFTGNLPSFLETLASAGLVLALVIFMLIRRQELRHRLIRLIGYGRLTLTTRALEDAGDRISRYLLAYSAINASFGVAVAIGLLIIGLPYAVLWGFLAAVLRFIPYVGAWMAALMPTALALAVFPGWTQPLLVLGLFGVLEPLIYFFLEPVLYGSRTGVSEVALLVALAFWTWLWGPIGLLIATPLTVCVVVVAKYVPELGFISILASDGVDIDPGVNFYQRLLAFDQDEAESVVKEYLEQRPRERVFDDVLLPALALMRRDRARNELGHEDVEFIVEATRETTEDLPAPSLASSPARRPGERTQDPAPTTVVLRPARDEADAVALHMLGDLLRAAEIAVETLSPRSSLPDALDLVARRHPDVVCIGTVVPGGITQMRHFCRSIRTRVPGVTLVAGVWGDPEVARTHAAALRESGADRVAASLIEARDFIVQRLGEHGAPGNSDVVVPDRVSPMTSVG